MDIDRVTAQLVYYIATTLDGHIAHPDGSYEGFKESGPHADAFVKAIAGFSAVLMGRKTYETGLNAGLPIGAPAYPGRPNYVFSQTMKAPPTASSELSIVSSPAVSFVNELKQRTEGSIWLCGGGQLAGALIESGLVDELRLKINPTLFGRGRPLAPGLTQRQDATLIATEVYDNDVVVLRLRLTKRP